MSDFEIATLKAEIARLNKLITVLIEQNDALKYEIAVANSTNGNPDVGIANVKITNGNTEIGGALAKVTNGNPEHLLAVAKVTNGNTNVLSTLPVILSMNTVNITRLRMVLKREGFNKVRHKAVANASKLLLHFYNKQRGDYNELCKLTGLSDFGLAKYICSLKKKRFNTARWLAKI